MRTNGSLLVNGESHTFLSEPMVLKGEVARREERDYERGRSDVRLFACSQQMASPLIDSRFKMKKERQEPLKISSI